MYERFGKRALDACLAFCALIVSAPLLILIGLCVLLLDGPGCFRQPSRSMWGRVHPLQVAALWCGEPTVGLDPLPVTLESHGWGHSSAGDQTR